VHDLNASASDRGTKPLSHTNRLLKMPSRIAFLINISPTQKRRFIYSSLIVAGTRKHAAEEATPQ
jgi:hypothetical protein